MTRAAKQSTYISVSLSEDEKADLDAAALAAGKNRNRFVRDWIATLRKKA
jgi:uncharacterized protein (DUF1778 family)